MENNKKIVITGGTTGIGFSCASYLPGRGYEVVITGKSKKSARSYVKEIRNIP